MTSAFPVLPRLLGILRFARDYFKRFPCQWASFLTFLSRMLQRSWLTNPRTSPSPKPFAPSFLGIRANPYSVSDGLAVVRECTIAASHVPASASYPDLHECAERQQATVAPTGCISSPTLDSFFVNPHPFGGTSHVNRSSGNLSVASIQSRAGDRLSFITNPHESIHPPFSEPRRVHGPIYRQYGRGPDPSRLSRPPSPLNHPHTSHQPPRLEIITTDLPSPGHGDGNVNPVVWPSASFSYTHELLSSPSMHGSRRKQTAASMLVDIQNPSTGPFRTSSSTHRQQIADEPFSIDSETAPSSPVSDPATLRDEFLLSSAASAKSSFYLPDGRTVRLFTSDQVPRYTKGDKM